MTKNCPITIFDADKSYFTTKMVRKHKMQTNFKSPTKSKNPAYPNPKTTSGHTKKKIVDRKGNQNPSH